MISILIPTYNYNIVPLVETLHHQSSNSDIPVEIIVVDDCSSNKTLQEKNSQIKSLENCQYIVNSKNKGRTASRGILADLAAYEHLLFLDADVFPKKSTFLQEYATNLEKVDLVFGGIIYEEKKPEKDKILRWKYGHSRESSPLSHRKKNPYLTINSGCFLIKKNTFIEVNNQLLFKGYGLDNLFKQILEEKDVTIRHIDNPVYHLGLEKNTVFIKKSLESIETTILLEKKGLIKDDLRPLQKTYLKCKTYGILSILRIIINLFEQQMISNFNSKNPSLFLFDLYRLYYYDKLKKHA